MRGLHYHSLALYCPIVVPLHSVTLLTIRLSEVVPEFLEVAAEHSFAIPKLALVRSAR